MKKGLLSLLLLLIALVTSATAQNNDLTNLRRDFPLLTERYADRLESRTAHYIFAIDISNSMKQYEQTVRNSLISFVNAVPDGDQISIIVMADKQNTDFLDNIQCATLNSEVRSAIVDALRSPRFTFSKDGSDGYTMTSRVLEAMNSVGSSDLTFIYMLTDFEYWTSRNHFNKGAEDWAALSSQLSEKHRGLLCKYGIELNFDKVKHPEAIFKPELEQVFGSVDYRQASSATLLSQWFGHIIDNIRANKINAMLKADWKALCDSSSMVLSTSGAKVMMKIGTPGDNLVEGYHATLPSADGFEGCLDVEGKLGKPVALGQYKVDRPWYPSFTRVGGDSLQSEVRFDSPYANEIAHLQDVCGAKGDNRLKLNVNPTLKVPARWMWNSSVPMPVWALIILIVIALVASVVYTLTQKFDKRLSFTVYHKKGGNSLPYSGDTKRYPYTIGDGKQLDVPQSDWTVRIEAKKGIPVAFGLKGGYYVTLVNGTRATLFNNRNDKVLATLRRGQEALLFGRKTKKPLRLELEEADSINISTIEIN